MSDARRRAEEALRMFDQTATPEPHEVYLYRAIAALREILAEPDGADRATETLRLIAARLADVHHVTIRRNGKNEDGGWIGAMVRATLKPQEPCSLLRTPTPGQDLTRVLFPRPSHSPAADEVREAAERLRRALCAVPSWEALLPKQCGLCEGMAECSGDHEPCGCHETLAVIEEALALLSALAARGGA